MAKTRKRSVQRFSHTEIVTATAMQAYAHDSTEEISRRRDILMFEGTVLDEEVSALQSKLSNAKSKRRRIDATLHGLGLVVGKR